MEAGFHQREEGLGFFEGVERSADATSIAEPLTDAISAMVQVDAWRKDDDLLSASRPWIRLVTAKHAAVTRLEPKAGFRVGSNGFQNPVEGSVPGKRKGPLTRAFSL